MRSEKVNTIKVKAKKEEKMLFRITIWGGIITGILITLIILFVK